MEWSLCYVGSVWLVSFVGYVRYVKRRQERRMPANRSCRYRRDTSGNKIVGEREPLLESAA